MCNWEINFPHFRSLPNIFKIVIEHLVACPDDSLEELELRNGFKIFVADNNPPADPALVPAIIYILTHGKIPHGLNIAIDSELLSTYNFLRMLSASKNVPTLA